MAVRKNEEKLFNLNKTQEVLYQREFKKAEQMYRKAKGDQK